MSVISAPIHGLGPATRKYVAARRSGNLHGVLATKGYLYCISCGGSTVSMADFARHVGVNPAAVSAFLNRRPVRPDIAEAIRAAVHHVDGEG